MTGKITQVEIDLFKKVASSISWDILPFSQDELLTIKKKYSYEDSNYSQSALADLIRNKIKEIICSQEGQSTRKLFWELNRTFLFQFHIDNVQNCLFSNIIGNLLHVFGNEDLIQEINEEKLNEALLCFKDKLRLYNHTKISSDKDDQSDGRIMAVSNSVKKLRDKFSIKYKIEHGNVWLDNEEFSKVGNHLLKYMNDLGGLTFQESMVEVLTKNKKYSPTMQRFLFPMPASQMGDKINPTVPWGYLFNLSLRAPHRGSLIIQDKNPLWSDLINYSTALLSTLDIEPFSIWDTEYKTGEATFKMLSEMGLLESNFRISQVRAADVMKMFKGLFSWTTSSESSLFTLTYSNLNYFINSFQKQLSSNQPQLIRIDSLRATMSRLSDKQFNAAMSVYCHNFLANGNFSSPIDYLEVDGFMKPLIKLNEDEVLIPLPSHSCVAIFEATMSYYRNLIPKFDDMLGTSLENFIKAILDKLKIPYLSGEYKNSDGEKGEIDISIEFEDLIGLIEIKKKSITRKSKSGDGDSLLFDIHKSLLDSQFQALGHEYTLHKDGEIKFADKTKLSHKGRRIEKITLTLFDYGALQDRTIIRQILTFYLQCRFNTSSPDKRYKDLNDKCDKFSQKYMKFSSLLGTNENIPFFGSCFFSIPQFLILLDGVKDAAGLKQAIFNTKFTTSKSLDWYFEHEYMSGIRTSK